jgi:hypothetical protein
VSDDVASTASAGEQRGRPVAWIGERAPGDARCHTVMRREGSRLILREIDPGEPEPDRIPVYEGETVEIATGIHSVSLNTTPDVGDTAGCLFSLRVVFLRREPGKVFVRTLRLGEPDDGRRVFVAPGEDLIVEQIQAELAYIDTLEEPTASGYIPLTPTLAIWYSIGDREGEREAARARYLLAAARRLDAANLDAISAVESYQALDDSMAGPVLRRTAFELLSRTETLIVALGRVIDIVMRAAADISATVEVPAALADRAAAVRALRNAVEHIEDRALGRVNRSPDPVALTLFDQSRLMTEGSIVYAAYELNLTSDVPELISASRKFLLDVAGE